MPQKQPDRQTAARVPDAEQPYPVPDNWAWVELQTCFAIVSEKIDPQIDHVLPYVGLEHIKKGAGLLALGQSDEVKSTKTAFKKNDVLYGKLRPYLDKHFVADIDGICSTDILVLRANQHSSAPFLNYYFSVPCVIQYAIEHSHGIHLPRVSPKDIGKMPLPLPPLAEQRRIVAKLDALLGKLRAARDLLDAARDSFALRRAAILHKAFSGQLTAAWRAEHNKLHDWATLPLGRLCQTIQYGYTESASQDAIGPKFLRITDIQDHQVDWETVPFCQIAPHDLEKYRLRSYDIVVARTGATTGKSFLINDPPEAVFASYLIRLTIDSATAMPQFVWYAMQTVDYWIQITENKCGLAQPGVNGRKLAGIRFPVPPIEEQREIVRRLDALLTHEAEAAALLDMDERLDLLEQSILARAFRGELGTRDPADAPAVVE